MNFVRLFKDTPKNQLLRFRYRIYLSRILARCRAVRSQRSKETVSYENFAVKRCEVKAWLLDALRERKRREKENLNIAIFANLSGIPSSRISDRVKILIACVSRLNVPPFKDA